MTESLSALSKDGPWVHELPEGEAVDVVLRARRQGAAVVELDASRMHTVEELYREFVREFVFPEYFGWNWAAYSECMRDLSWYPAPAYLIVIRHVEELLADEPGDLPTFLRQLEHIGQRWSHAFGLGPEWGAGEVPFNTILVRPVIP